MFELLKELIVINEAKEVKYEYVIQKYYEGEWEDVCTVDTKDEALVSVKECRINEKGTQFRFVRRKESNE